MGQWQHRWLFPVWQEHMLLPELQPLDVLPDDKRFGWTQWTPCNNNTGKEDEPPRSMVLEGTSCEGQEHRWVT